MSAEYLGLAFDVYQSPEDGAIVVHVETDNVSGPIRIRVNDGPAVFDADPELPVWPYTCAECGTTTAQTYVVTTLDYNDREGTRTEVCRECDDVLRGAQS